MRAAFEIERSAWAIERGESAKTLEAAHQAHHQSSKSAMEQLGEVVKAVVVVKEESASQRRDD
jgi:hypothetical protein